MAYRGDDLDLRVPQGWSSGPRMAVPPHDDVGGLNGRWPRTTAAAGRSEPLWVDETVMACCNHAYDVALAHGAAEVRLEHLVHALTRVDAASQILESRGIREGQLRRDSAALIANEVPLGIAGERGSPRRAAELEDVLRRASSLAQRRGAVASVDDLLYVLLNSPRETEAIAMLRRHAPDWQRLEWVKSREVRHVVAEPRMEPLFMPEPMTSRLEVIESALRAIHAELAGDRKLLSDIVRDLQREVAAQRGDNVVLGNSLADRLEAFEQQLVARTEALRHSPQIVDRLQSIERSVQAGVGERLQALEKAIETGLAATSGPIDQRLQTLEKAVHSGMAEGARNWAALFPRLGGLDGIGELQTALQPVLTHMSDRVATLERLVESRFTDTVRGWTALADRMQALERLTQTGSGESTRQLARLDETLGELRQLVQAPRGAAAEPEIVQLTERMALVERAVRTGLSDQVRSASLIADRLGIVEKVVTSRDDNESALLLEERLRALETTVEGRARETGGRWQQLIERLDAMESRLAAAKPQAGVMAPVAAGIDPRQVVTRLEALDTAAVARSTEHAQAVATIGGRISALEQVIQLNAAAIDEASRQRVRDVEELHEGLVRLSENQQTLARALNEWRLESKGDLSIIANRLEDLPYVRRMIEAAVAQPADATPAATAAPAATVTPASAPAAPATAAVREAARPASYVEEPATVRRGFWWWLFGTGNVRRANRDAELRWQKMHHGIKAARERIRERR